MIQLRPRRMPDGLDRRGMCLPCGNTNVEVKFYTIDGVSFHVFCNGCGQHAVDEWKKETMDLGAGWSNRQTRLVRDQENPGSSPGPATNI